MSYASRFKCIILLRCCFRYQESVEHKMDSIGLPPIIFHNIYENTMQSEFSLSKHTFIAYDSIFNTTIYPLHTISYPKYISY